MTITEWYNEYIKLSAQDIFLIKDHINRFVTKPLISLLTPVYNTKEIWLRKCIESVINQIYQNWELCICDNGGNRETTAILQEYAAKDTRIKIVRLEANQGGFGGTNVVLEIATGDFIGFMDSDDEILPHTLYLVANEINNHSDANVIYTDEAMWEEDQLCSGIFFKPDFSPDLLHSELSISHLSLWKGDLLKSLKLQDSAGSHDYDLVLRTMEVIPWSTFYHIPVAAYLYRQHSNALSTKTYSYCVQGAVKALKKHLERIGRKATVHYDWPWYRTQYHLDNPPHVNICVASINKNGLLYNFLEHLLSKTDYPNYTICLAVPPTVKELVIKWFAALIDENKIKFAERTESEEFNYSILANNLNKISQGPVLCLINDDIEPLNYNWLTELVSHVVHPETGAVGAKLLYPNLTYQHAGVITGIDTGIGITSAPTAAHIFKGQPLGSHGYFGRAKLTGNCSVVTGACLVVRKEVYDQVAGYDENFKVAYGDVDFCLKIKKAGYYNVYVPNATLLHKESQSRGPDDTPRKLDILVADIKTLTNKWGKTFLMNDPFYNPNLSLRSINFDIAPLNEVRYKKPWLF